MQERDENWTHNYHRICGSDEKIILKLPERNKRERGELALAVVRGGNLGK